MEIIVFLIGVVITLLGLTCGLSCRYSPVMDKDTQVPIHGALSTVGVVVLIAGALL